MNPLDFLNNHFPPAIFSSKDYCSFKGTIRRILDPHRTFIKNHFNKGKLVSLKGYALEKVVDGKYEDLSSLELWLFYKGLEYLGCME